MITKFNIQSNELQQLITPALIATDKLSARWQTTKRDLLSPAAGWRVLSQIKIRAANSGDGFIKAISRSGDEIR